MQPSNLNKFLIIIVLQTLILFAVFIYSQNNSKPIHNMKTDTSYKQKPYSSVKR